MGAWLFMTYRHLVLRRRPPGHARTSVGALHEVIVAAVGFLPRLHPARQVSKSNNYASREERCVARSGAVWAQFRHTRCKQKGRAFLQALECLVAGAGFEPATFGL